MNRTRVVRGKVMVGVGALILLGSALASRAEAQSRPRFEGNGGYSVLRLNLPGTVEGEDTSFFQSILGNTLGWNAGFTANVTDMFGITADISGYYRKFSGEIDGDTVKADAKLHSLLLGPRVSARREKVLPFAQTLFGFGKLSASATDSSGVISGSSQRETFSNTGFAMSFGGGVDVVVSEKVSIRAIQFDFFPVRQKSQDINQGNSLTLNNFRFGTGIVFALGN